MDPAWVAVAISVVSLVINGGGGGWIYKAIERRRKFVDARLEALEKDVKEKDERAEERAREQDECLHRVEKVVLTSNAEVMRFINETENNISKSLAAFQAQVPSRSEVESRIAREVSQLQRDIDRIDRTTTVTSTGRPRN
jgi:sugar-specific transcriptional regulator TrmB